MGDVAMHWLWYSIFNVIGRQTKLTWIVGKTEMGLLSGIGGVELVPYDKKSGWKGVWNFMDVFEKQSI